MSHNNRKFYVTTATLLLGISVLVFGLVPTLVLAAGDPSIADGDPSISNGGSFLRRPPGEQFVNVRVQPDYVVTQSDVLTRTNYRVFRASPTGTTKDRFLEIDRVTPDPDETKKLQPGEKNSSVRIYLSPPLDISADDRLIVTYVGKTLAGKEVKGTPTAEVKNPLGSPPSADTPTPAPPAKFTLKKADGRDDADLYFQGIVTTGSGKAASGSVDLKFRLPFYAKPRHHFSLFADLKASSAADADPDTLKFGMEIRSLLLRSESAVSGIFWYNNGSLEGDRSYDNLNLVFSSIMRFPLRTIWLSNQADDRAFVNLTPYFGIEFGKNLKSPVSEAEGRGIARPTVGTYLYSRVYQGNQTFARVTLDGLYQRRWALTDEVHFKDVDGMDAQGKPIKVTVPVFFGKKSTQWGEVNLNFNVSEVLGLFVGYQYGELPPAYKLVDHIAKIGVVLKAKIK